nr:MAG TPA: hypothetical protein [Caudoviricetes sp.]
MNKSPMRLIRIGVHISNNFYLGGTEIICLLS